MKKKKMARCYNVLILLLFILGGGIFIFAVENNVEDEKQWRESISKHRQQKDVDFKSSATSPMAAVKRLVVKPDQKAFINNTNREIILSQVKDTGVQFSLFNKKNKWHWENFVPGVICKTADIPLASGSSFTRRTLFQVGRYTITAYPSKDNLVLLVFDPLREEIKHFSALVYFPPDRAYAVQAFLKKFPKITKTTMLTSRNQEKVFYRYATVHFKIDGTSLRLTAFKYALQGDDSDILFIPFADKTNDKETYGSGRFLEIPEPGESRFVLDFNLCFNPLCNYSPDVYNCPLPPFENILDIPIKAGEMTYPH